MQQPEVLTIPPVTPEQLYFQDKRRRERDAEEQRYRRWDAEREERRRGRRVVLTTDDPDEAFAELRKRRMTGMKGWDLAEVRWMEDPPKTVHKYCVFRHGPTSREKHGI